LPTLNVEASQLTGLRVNRFFYQLTAPVNAYKNRFTVFGKRKKPKLGEQRVRARTGPIRRLIRECAYAVQRMRDKDGDLRSNTYDDGIIESKNHPRRGNAVSTPRVSALHSGHQMAES
jgi:hypothetical protein